MLYVGTFSKVFAPALMLGFLVAPPPVLAAAMPLRFDIDCVAERALAELLEEGELARHLLRARALYAARRDHAVAQLRTHLSHVLSFEPPRGGMAMWAEVIAPYRADAFVGAAREHGADPIRTTRSRSRGRHRTFASATAACRSSCSRAR